MNICLEGWFGQIKGAIRNSSSRGYFEFGAHIFCIHLYNLAVQAIEERNICVLEFLAKIDAIVFFAEEEQSLFGDDGVQKLIDTFPQGKFKINIPVEYLNKDGLTKHHIAFEKKGA